MRFVETPDVENAEDSTRIREHLDRQELVKAAAADTEGHLLSA